MYFRKTLESKENNEKVKHYKIQMMYTNFQFYIRQSKSKNIIFKMNFSYNNFAQTQSAQGIICNNHKSHHCIHSHSCNKKNHNRKQSKQKNKLKNTIKENTEKTVEIQVCQFKNDFKYQKSLQNIEKENNLLLQSQKEKTQLKRKIHQLQKNLLKDQDQKKDLRSQLTYYRQQFTRLIQCNNNDMKKEIKKRLEETQDLTFKSKNIQTKNNNLVGEIKDLKQQKQFIELKLQKINLNYEHLILERSVLAQKLKKSYEEKKKANDQCQRISRQKKQNEEKYKIILTELKKKIQILQQSEKTLSSELYCLKISKNSEQKKNKNEAQLNIIKLHQMSKQIQFLRKQNQERLKEKQQIENFLKQQTNKCNELAQELNHTKKMIQVRIFNNIRQLQRDRREKNLFSQKNYQLKENQEKVEKSQKEQIYLKQIQRLKQEIQKIKSQSNENIEEVILRIGASQTFKRILDQKNVIIKQLMREKAQLKSISIIGKCLSV